MTSLLTDLSAQPRSSGFVLGNSPAIRKLNAIVEDIAGTNIPVLLMGESGTGKDVYARVIHLLSGPGDSPALGAKSCTATEGELQSGGTPGSARSLEIELESVGWASAKRSSNGFSRRNR